MFLTCFSTCLAMMFLYEQAANQPINLHFIRLIVILCYKYPSKISRHAQCCRLDQGVLKLNSRETEQSIITASHRIELPGGIKICQ